MLRTASRPPDRLGKAFLGAAGFVTRLEGQKFLQLQEDFDRQTIRPPGSDEPVSLYVHIPFCRTLCPFCCFNRYLFNEKQARVYFRNLEKELDLYIERGFRFSNVYFGGGTPTILMDELMSYIQRVKAKFQVKEISLETSARELSPQTVKALEGAGVKRLSMGIQSFDDSILKAMGRAAITGDEAKEKLRMAQGHFDTVNADLIFNFPGQSIERFEADVKTFKEMGIDQATFYPLMPSPHKKSAMERRFKSVDTSRERDFYDVILRELYEGGYRVSTAWCFSRHDAMIDEYIVDYDDYVGIGAGSVSFVKGDFYVNTFSLEKYDTLISRGDFPVVRWKRLSEREHLRYYLLTKLFGMTIDPARFEKRFGAGLYRKLGPELHLMKLFGLIESDGKITVTRKGMYAVSSMMKEFFASLNSLREHCIENKV